MNSITNIILVPKDANVVEALGPYNAIVRRFNDNNEDISVSLQPKQSTEPKRMSDINLVDVSAICGV